MLKQVGALPFRVAADGSIEVLLVTSRRSGRWIIPKGNIDDGRDTRTMAAVEALEEAGVSGALLDDPVGHFGYDKYQTDGSIVAAEVEVFALAVTEMHDNWAEMADRQRRWVSYAEAAEIVEEPDLAGLLLVFGTLRQGA